MSPTDRNPERENPEDSGFHLEVEDLPEPLQSDLEALFGNSDSEENLTVAERAIHDRLLSEVRDPRRKSGRFTGARAGLVAACLLGAVSAALYLKPANESASTLDSAKIVASDTHDLADISPLDRDRNGAVDIRDAFLLARQLRDENAPEDADLNADGRIDHRDFELIAQTSVRLSEGK